MMLAKLVSDSCGLGQLYGVSGLNAKLERCEREKAELKARLRRLIGAKLLRLNTEVDHPARSARYVWGRKGVAWGDRP